MDPFVFPVGVLILAVLAGSIFLHFVPVGLWISALAADVNISLFNLVGMRIRRVEPRMIVLPLIKGIKAGLSLNSNQLEAHYLAGGNVDNVVDALIAAHRAQIALSFEQAAAIDLAGICSKVTVFEFMDELKADSVLQEKAKSLSNVEIFVSSQTVEVIGDGDKLTALRIKDCKTEEECLVELDGVFVQIGLAANSASFRDVVEMNRSGEIVIDTHGRTNVPGIYAAGDVSTVPYKQIIIAMGEGAKAALSAFEDRVRGVI